MIRQGSNPRINWLFEIHSKLFITVIVTIAVVFTLIVALNRFWVFVDIIIPWKCWATIQVVVSRQLRWCVVWVVDVIQFRLKRNYKYVVIFISVSAFRPLGKLLNPLSAGCRVYICTLSVKAKLQVLLTGRWSRKAKRALRKSHFHLISGTEKIKNWLECPRTFLGVLEDFNNMDF